MLWKVIQRREKRFMILIGPVRKHAVFPEVACLANKLGQLFAYGGVEGAAMAQPKPTLELHN